MFQSVIIFWLPLVSATLALYLKTAALGCATDNVIVEESIINILKLKAIKLAENADIRKAMAMLWREANDRQEHWLNALRVAKIRSNLHTGQYIIC